MKPIIALIAAVALFLTLGSPAFAHCEIPCGIYDDEARLDEIAEHITTIEKSMNQIIALSKEDSLNYNQLVRWINNKENHANELQHIVTQYFMTQRVKPIDKDDAKPRKAYAKKLTLLHRVLIYAMKAKQTTDLDNVEKLRSLLADFRSAYFGQAE
jgi:nickel superoxide dismutase